MEYTKESASNILKSRSIFEQKGVKHSTKVAYVATQDRKGNPLVQYAGTEAEETVTAIYIKAYTANNMKVAFNHYKNGEFEEALAVPMLSIALPTEKAREFETGDNVTVVLGTYINDAGDTVTCIDTIKSVGMATETIANPFATVSKQVDVKANA